ncbi:DUF2304 domain-containing protein [Candidatus Bipolaricaulota bacterium]
MEALRGIDVLLIVVGVLFLARSAILVRKREEDVAGLLIWLALGAMLIVGGAIPSALRFAVNVLGMKDRAFAFFATGILVAYLLIFRQSRLLHSEVGSISRLNEELSLLRQRVRQLEGRNAERDRDDSHES